MLESLQPMQTDPVSVLEAVVSVKKHSNAQGWVLIPPRS